ncbi:uncharacterized protein LOC117500509 isoform X6 [Trematomus bernacchii]|uniref:uncharacterized protein LOC117500509 isoform X6 n=1 Tax=Trematomus bernacchii TaxID=40690 RepID=UPI00146E9AA0|nr:uncharacterized protein LOC117500509 isoform X6 [Trematomus bernacchii]
MEEGVHRYYVLFVDKHRLALVQRVKNIEPILDGLLSYKVINRENYEEILSLHGPQEKMRSLLRGPLRVCGPGGKEIFYKLLREHESDLLDDLADESEKYKKNKKDMEVESMGAQKRLLETLNDLSSDEFNQFKSLIELEESFPRILRGRLKVANTDETVDLMVKTFSGKCVNMNKTVLKKMNRTDLVQRLSDISSGTKEEPLPSLIQSVEMMASVIELLLETLKDLSDQDLQRFQRVLNKIQSDKDYPHISPRWLMMSDRQDMVFSLVRDHGQQSVEMTQHIFSRIRRTDLVQRLSQSSSGPKKKHSEAQRPAVIQKVATMAAVKHLLLETLNDLRNEDLEKFKQSLDLIVTMNKQINMSWEWRSSTGRAQTVEQIIQIFGQQCVEITMEVLKDIKRTDLMQRFTKPSSELKEMYSVDEHRPAQSEGAPIAAVKPILLKTLKDLSGDELDRFQCLLQFTYFQKSISYSFHGYPYQTGSALELVDQMVETCGPQSVEVTREVLMDLNRTDLVERLSETILRLKEKPLPSLIQRVETMASVIELLLETLKDLSDQDLQRFQRVLNKIQSDKGYPDISPRWLMMRDRQDMVFYLVQDHSQHRLLEMTTEAFERMNRTDLVQRLSQSSSGPKKKHSDAQRPAVIQKVATMAAVKHLLLETLNDLRNEDLEKFKQTLDLIVSKKKLRYFSWILRSSAGRAQTVEQMIQIFGQQCVEITMEVLKNINRTDLRQRLTKPCSELKEMYSVDEHRPAQSEGAPIAAEKEILLKTLKDLSGDELYRFQWYLQFTYFQKSISSFHGYPYQTGSALQLVDQMVETCGPQSVEVTREVLMDMKTSDLVERLSETILRLKEKPLPSLIQRVETMASVIELLLETLKDLSHQDLESFQMVLSQILSDNGYTQILLRWLMMRDRQDMVFSLVQDHGDHRLLEMTTEAFEKMNRTDLVQRLSQSSSGPKKKHSEAQRPAVIQKVATMAAVKHLLLETLNDLRNEDLDKFKQTLDLIVSKKKRRYVSWILSSSTGRAQTVEKIIQIFGQQCVEITMEVLKDINRTDLRQRFTNLELKEMYSVDEHRPAQSEGDSSGWTKLEPEVNSTDEDEASTYSLKSEAGNFECSVSGLRWVCQEKVSFKYQFCSSEEPMKRMEMMKYMPAGPLIDITVISGKLFEVYLPHWICIDDIPKILQKFAVLHIDDCGDVVEKVSEVTSSHVKLSEPVFSPRAVLMKMGFPVKIHCNVLIYSKAYASCTVLHVYLTPLDPALKETIDKDNKEYKFIRKPRPDEGLTLHKGFNLTAGTTAEICPEKITLSNSSQSQRSIFFDVHFKNPISDFNLTLSQLKKGKRKPRWSHKILKEEATSGPSSENESRDTARPSAGETAQYTMVDGEHFVDKHRTELINRVNCVEDILDQLLGKVITQSIYNKIIAIPTSQQQMRKLFSGPLNAAGAKEVFYRILEKEEKYLIDELKGNK